MNVVEFPKSCANDIPYTLRALADQIEKGEHGTVEHLVWVIRDTERVVSTGLSGQAQYPRETAYFLMSVALASLVE